MNAQVVAAIIAASVSVLTLIGTLAAQYFGRRATSRDTENTLNRTLAAQRGQLDKTLAEQRDQLDKTLKAQSDQLDRTLGEQRTRTFNERFATAAEQLGGDKPPAVQLAGVYAMAVLADDWEKNRQTCVDVLCAYLRMPYEPDPGADAPAKEQRAFRASREVRHTVIRVIAAHLKDGVKPSWQGLNFDFTGAVIDGGDFSGARFSGMVSFWHAEFSGGAVILFDGAKFSGGKVDFTGAKFSGEVRLQRTNFSGGEVDFSNAEFSGGTVSFERAEFSGSRVDFRSASFSGGEVDFRSAKFSGGYVSLFVAEFSGGTVRFSEASFSGGTVAFDAAKFSGGRVVFHLAKFSGGRVVFLLAKFSGGEVDFQGAEFSAGTVDFDSAEFSSGSVSFTHGEISKRDARFVSFHLSDHDGKKYLFDAKFSGGEVDFSIPKDWSVPPQFPWTDKPPPGVLLPTDKDQSQA